jgi:protein-S-isoprenylcysteine O-methyltransferase Ste14
MSSGPSTAMPFAGLESFSSPPAAHYGFGPSTCSATGSAGWVAIQPGHTLLTTGIYGVIRHPSYLGMLVNALGRGLAFRSWACVLLAALLVPLLLARIRSEEALLRAQFGAAYDAYCARTSRLIPGIF